MGDLLRVPLTTVSWSRENQGKRAGELIFDRLGPDPPDKYRRVIIPPELVIRESTRSH
jgi:DNA-binding LacI/PurR family transcriptional regulator